MNTDLDQKVTEKRVIILQDTITQFKTGNIKRISSKTRPKKNLPKFLKKQKKTRLNDSLFFSRVTQSVASTEPKETIIRYYVKEKDADKVMSLEKLGYYIHERPSPLRSTFSSNSMYVGDDVSNSEVLLVAFTLIKAGVEIRSIQFSREHAGWKSKSIEIGTDTTILAHDVITLSDLRHDWSGM